MPNHASLNVEPFVLGPYQTNCYVVSPADSQAEDTRCAVVDCGFEPRPLLDRAQSFEQPPEAFVMTHAHLDHIAGLNEARSVFAQTPIWIHTAEERWLTDAEMNLSFLGGTPVTAPPADRLLTDCEEIEFAGHRWQVLHTPGHSPGSVSYFCEQAGVALVGDALFAGSIGRTDFPGSDHDTLITAIREKLFTLPPETVIYPGHGPSSTIEREMATNPFVRG